MRPATLGGEVPGGVMTMGKGWVDFSLDTWMLLDELERDGKSYPLMVGSCRSFASRDVRRCMVGPSSGHDSSSSREVSATSAFSKKGARSATSPRAFQVSPVRDIWSHRDAFPSAIHRCRVDIRSKVYTEPSG
jgi:hypothetical protein